MTPEEIKIMQDENIALKQQVNDLGVEKNKLITDVTERDTTIATLKTQAGERAEQFKKFKDMSEAEKELLSEKEKELLQRQDQLEEDRKQDLAERAEHNRKIKEATISNIATKFAKGDKDLTEQIKINLGKLSPELLDKAITEEEITPFVQDAFNMTGAGNTQGDLLREAINTDGLPARVSGEKDFSDTKEGQDLGKAMGLGSFNNNNNQ